MVSGTIISKGVHVGGLISRGRGVESTALLLKFPARREIGVTPIRIPQPSAESVATLKGWRVSSNVSRSSVFTTQLEVSSMTLRTIGLSFLAFALGAVL